MNERNENKPQQSASGYNYNTAKGGVTDVRLSADIIAALIVERFHPGSAVDFGCGLGDWLAALRAAGIRDVLGLDGAWVPREGLQIAPGTFRQADLTQSIKLERKYEVALCLEVAEHLPDSFADNLLDSLTAAADLIVFSAAIPGQGGFKHVNERFQGDWVERFAARGFGAFDLIRPQVWLNPRVLPWYQQNLLIFANPSAVQRYRLQAHPFIASLVHPDLYRVKMDPRNWSVRQIIRHAGWYLQRTLGWRTVKGEPLARFNNGMR